MGETEAAAQGVPGNSMWKHGSGCGRARARPRLSISEVQAIGYPQAGLGHSHFKGLG